MADVREYSQYQCDCGFRTRSLDVDEVVEIVQNHADRKHDTALSRDDIEPGLRTLELEGLPDNT
jgi:predicted small metal-binding protein